MLQFRAMSRRDEPLPGRPGRRREAPRGAIKELLDAGDHRAAAEEARRHLADAGTTAADRAAAAAALRSLRPEPGAVAVGLAGLALSAAVVLWTALGAGR